MSEKARADLSEDFVLQLGLYAVGSSLLTLGFATLIRLTSGSVKGKHGMFVNRNWPQIVRDSMSLLLVLFCLVPSVCVVSCFALGPVIAAIEGWTVIIGIEYLLGNAMDMPGLLSGEHPQDFFGKMFDIVVMFWIMIIFTCSIGFSANLGFVTNIAQQMPATWSGFFRYLLMYIPFSFVVLSLITGFMVAVVEGWSYGDGFYYMAGNAAGVELVNMRPETVSGMVIEAVMNVVEAGLESGILGLMITHPVTTKIVQCVEGYLGEDDAPAPDAAPPAEPPDPLPAMDTAMLKVAIQAHEKRLEKMHRVLAAKQQEVLGPGQYLLLVDATVTVGSSTETEHAVELEEGTQVNVLETKELPGEKKLRGRIDKPAGWISMRDTSDGFLWVVPLLENVDI